MISQISDGPTAKRMKIDRYCQRQRCKHVDRRNGRIGAILACFRVARVCQRQLGFLVFSRVLYNKNHVLHSLLPERNDHGYVLRRRRHERVLFLRPMMTNAIS